MTWTGDPRTSTATWKKTRDRILERDAGVCHACHRPGATEVDHLVALKAGGTDSDTNLAAIHRTCHAKKSSQEGNQARWRHRAARPTPKHPGLL